MQKSMYEEALAEFEVERCVSKEWMAEVETRLGTGYARAGRSDKAREILGDLLERSKRMYISPFMLALLCIVLDERDRAFEFLEEAYRSGDTDLSYLKIEPILDTVRSDPRYKAMLNRIGLAA
jgi:hypothetical protein